jgi:hypothetical protein
MSALKWLVLLLTQHGTPKTYGVLPPLAAHLHSVFTIVSYKHKRAGAGGEGGVEAHLARSQARAQAIYHFAMPHGTGSAREVFSQPAS